MEGFGGCFCQAVQVQHGHHSRQNQLVQYREKGQRKHQGIHLKMVGISCSSTSPTSGQKDGHFICRHT